MKLYADNFKFLFKGIWLFLLIATAPLFFTYGAAYGSMESEGLGLIIKSIEMVEEKPLLAAIFNIKTGRTIEYTLGDYVDGRLIRDILEDRVVLYDEITRHQFVLIYNDVVSAEENKERDVCVVRIKEKKRDIEEMNITNIFNNELNKARGDEPTAYGTPDSASEDEKKMEMQNYTREFQDSPDGFDKANGGDTGEVRQNTAPAGADKPAATAEVKIKDKPAAPKPPPEAKAADKPSDVAPSDTKAVEVNPAKPALKPPPAAATPNIPVKAEVKPPAGGVMKTQDGTTVRIREKAKKQAESDILDE